MAYVQYNDTGYFDTRRWLVSGSWFSTKMQAQIYADSLNHDSEMRRKRLMSENQRNSYMRYSESSLRSQSEQFEAQRKREEESLKNSFDIYNKYPALLELEKRKQREKEERIKKYGKFLGELLNKYFPPV